ncbi:kinase-like domain-containing protein [Suillus subluteus]|nr:kinase-like domain-containing protein [Suillus subluteus]
MKIECHRCRIRVPQELMIVHETQCRNRTITPTPNPHAHPSHQPDPHNTHTSQLQNPYLPPVAHPAVPQAFIPPLIVPGFLSDPSDSDTWRRELGQLRDKLLRKIEKSSELAMEDRQICREYVKDVKVYQVLPFFCAHPEEVHHGVSESDGIHLRTPETLHEQWMLLNELKQQIAEWRSWYYNDLMTLTIYRTIRDTLKSFWIAVKEFSPRHIVPCDDVAFLRVLLVLCGRDYENEFYDLTHNQAQEMVDLLEEILRDHATDHATHARLLRYIIRLSRKSGCLPCQLRLDGPEPTPMRVVEQGGSATIFTASYNDKAIAIKRSHLPSISQSRKDFVSEATKTGELRSSSSAKLSYPLPVTPIDWGFSIQAEGAAKGLCYLHPLDPPIVHERFAGLSNVLVDKRGNACLTDFGISRSDDTRQGLDSTNVGRRETLNWIAPELLFFGNSETMRVTLETDMYALACVLYKASGFVLFKPLLLASPHFRSIPEAFRTMERI